MRPIAASGPLRAFLSLTSTGDRRLPENQRSPWLVNQTNESEDIILPPRSASADRYLVGTNYLLGNPAGDTEAKGRASTPVNSSARVSRSVPFEASFPGA